MPTTQFSPGSVVEIIEGPHAGSRAFVLWTPADPEFVAVRLDEGAKRFDLPKTHVRALEGELDPWYPKFASWASSPAGRTQLSSGALTTGEILEALQLEDGFGGQVRATKILALLGAKKREVLRGVWVWEAQAIGDDWPAQPAHNKERGPSALAFVLAFNYFLLWLRSMPAIVKTVFDQVALICLRHQRHAKPEIVRWFRQGGVVLEQLRCEATESAVHDLQDVFFLCVESAAKDELRTGLEADEFHRRLVSTLVEAKQSRQGGEPIERTGEVNGWLLALADMVPLSRHESLAAETRGDTDAAGEFERQANALQWIVDAVGGAPTAGDVVVPPKANLLGSEMPLARRSLDSNAAANWAHDCVDGALCKTGMCADGTVTYLFGEAQRARLHRRVAVALQAAAVGFAPKKESNARSWETFIEEYELKRLQVYHISGLTHILAPDVREAIMKAVDLVATYADLEWRSAARALVQEWFSKTGQDGALVKAKHALRYFVYDCADTAEKVVKGLGTEIIESAEVLDGEKAHLNVEAS